MPKPASLPRWANVGGDIVEPSSGKKDIGWIDAELPPHSYFNWFMNLVYQWAVYLDGLTGEALTWTAAHTFNAAVTFAAAVTFNGAVTFNSTASFASLSTTGDLTVGDDLTVTGSVAGNLTLDNDLIMTAGGIVVNKTTATPASDNELVLGSFLKAWAEIQCNGTASPAVTAGLNIASVTADSSHVHVTLTRALGTAGVALTGKGNGLTPYSAQRDGGNGTTTFSFRIFNYGGGGVGGLASVDPAATNGPNFVFAIMGV